MKPQESTPEQGINQGENDSDTALTPASPGVEEIKYDYRELREEAFQKASQMFMADPRNFDLAQVSGQVSKEVCDFAKMPDAVDQMSREVRARLRTVMLSVRNRRVKDRAARAKQMADDFDKDLGLK